MTAQRVLEPDAANGLSARSAAQCQHVRAVSTSRTDEVRGTIGAVELRQIREIIGTLLDIDA
ncbi:MAG: hypothetical protein R8F63_00875 [Acidimicrobiales bacterium]|nr:hypothetical protein [Acidimicrobiales bacterium]